VIARLELESGESVPVYACVFGAVLELNRGLTPQVLAQDPLLDGHLAIILPSGTFPPRKESQHEKEEDQEATQPAKEAKIE
jgi:glycine cleavage system H lipoate-binding protein